MRWIQLLACAKENQSLEKLSSHKEAWPFSDSKGYSPHLHYPSVSQSECPLWEALGVFIQMQAPGHSTDLLNHLSGEEFGNGGSDAYRSLTSWLCCHSQAQLFPCPWHSTLLWVGLSKSKATKPQATTRPKGMMLTLPALTGKDEDMNAFSTRFLSKIPAINVL